MYHKISTIASVVLLACAVAPAIAAPIPAPAIPNTTTSGARAVGEFSGQKARNADGRALPGISSLGALGNLIPGLGAGGGFGAGGLGASGLGAGGLGAGGLAPLTSKRADIASLLLELYRREISEHGVLAIESALGVGTGVAAAQSLAAEIKNLLGGRELSVMNELD
ncbi:unnamed protein product [Mycena citricolor]|uniref:Uncharacterized protein n=1 Tax=Mycena citricolor TaxID=2018698 RepID=A0AAD2K8P8_9AGAR|nr:unnamed protein product [Mycena citricolor]